MVLVLLAFAGEPIVPPPPTEPIVTEPCMAVPVPPPAPLETPVLPLLASPVLVPVFIVTEKCLAEPKATPLRGDQ